MTTQDNLSQLKSLTQNTCAEYVEVNGLQMLLGYMDATENSIDALEKITSTCTSFNELKKELESFISKRKSFLGYIDRQYDEKTNSFKTFTPE